MEKIKIDVQNGLACDKNRYCATACRGRFTVVKFDFWGDNWFFNTNALLNRFRFESFQSSRRLN